MRNAQRGIVLALAALTLAGCGDGRDTSAEDLVRESATRTADVESFHFTLDIQNVPRSSAGLQLTAAEGDVSVPDRLQADVSGTFAGVPLTTQLISVGGKVWIKNPLSGSWQAVDVGTAPATLLDPQQGVLGAMRGLEGVEDDGTEELAGVATARVRGTASAADVAPLVAVPAGGGTVDVTLWIGADDRILRRIRIEGAVAHGEPSDATRVVDVSRFGEPVTIDAPEDVE